MCMPCLIVNTDCLERRRARAGSPCQLGPFAAQRLDDRHAHVKRPTVWMAAGRGLYHQRASLAGRQRRWMPDPQERPGSQTLRSRNVWACMPPIIENARGQKDPSDDGQGRPRDGRGPCPTTTKAWSASTKSTPWTPGVPCTSISCSLRPANHRTEDSQLDRAHFLCPVLCPEPTSRWHGGLQTSWDRGQRLLSSPKSFSHACVCAHPHTHTHTHRKHSRLAARFRLSSVLSCSKPPRHRLDSQDRGRDRRDAAVVLCPDCRISAASAPVVR